MTESTRPWGLEPDQPEDDLDADRFARRPFARHLAEALVHLPRESFVIGLEGVWGCGKTTVLNFLAREVGDLPLEEGQARPVVVRFNPWWFTGKDDLAARFFHEVACQLDPVGDAPSRHRELATTMDRLARVALPLTSLLLGKDRGEAASEVLRGLTAVGREAADAAAERESSLDEAKRKTEELLRELGTPIWVFLDDVDRLLPHEALEVLSLVRGLGDLPLVRYLLAYDRTELERRVAVAAGMDEAGARDYLNKIVQLSFPVPVPAAWRLRDAALLGLRRAHDHFGLGWNPASFEGALRAALGSLVRTPRDVKRLLNAYGLALAMLGPDLLHPPDVLVLELLRLEFPRLYEALPQEAALLLRFGDHPAANEERRKAAIDGLLQRTTPEPARGQAVRLLELVFPQVTGLSASSDEVRRRFEGSFAIPWALERRAASDAYFDAFFQRALDEDALKGSEVRRLTAFLEGGDGGGLGAYLRELDAQLVPRSTASRAFLALDWLDTLLKSQTTPEAWVTTALSALSDVSDELAASRHHAGGQPFHERAALTVFLLLYNVGRGYMPYGGVVEHLLDCLEGGAAIVTLADAVRLAATEQKGSMGSYGLTEEQVERARATLRARFDRGEHPQRPHPNLLWRLLPAWAWAEGADERPRAYVDGLLRSGRGARLGVLMGMAWGSGGGYSRPSEPDAPQLSALNQEAIVAFLDLNVLKESVRELEADADPKVAEFARRYLELLERQMGQTPS